VPSGAIFVSSQNLTRLTIPRVEVRLRTGIWRIAKVSGKLMGNSLPF